MSPEELVTHLAPIRLPAGFAGFGPLDALVAFAIGILVSLSVRALLPSLRVRVVPPVASARARIAALSALPDDERLYRLALLLRELDPDRGCAPSEEVTRALYDPAAQASPARLECLVLLAAERRGKTR